MNHRPPIKTHHLNTLTELFDLPKGDLMLLVEQESVPVYDFQNETFAGWLPSIDKYFTITPDLSPYLIKNINQVPVEIKIENVMLEITGDKNTPPTSIIYGTEWLNKVNQLVTLNKEFKLLIPERYDIPVYLGHGRMIERLAENFSCEIQTIYLEELQEKRGQ